MAAKPKPAPRDAELMKLRAELTNLQSKYQITRSDLAAALSRADRAEVTVNALSIQLVRLSGGPPRDSIFRDERNLLPF